MVSVQSVLQTNFKADASVLNSSRAQQQNKLPLSQARLQFVIEFAKPGVNQTPWGRATGPGVITLPWGRATGPEVITLPWGRAIGPIAKAVLAQSAAAA